MKVNDEVAAISKDILAWTNALGREDRPRVSAVEVPLLIHYASALKPGNELVEIGTGWGGTAALFHRVCAPGVEIFTMDNGSNFRRFGPRDGTEYDFFLIDRFINVYSISAGDLGARLIWTEADSTEAEWIGRPIDLLFIDGAHTYEGVKGDIENMVPHVISGGAVIFHDYHMGGVKAAVDEFLAGGGLAIENRAGSAIAVRVAR